VRSDQGLPGLFRLSCPFAISFGHRRGDPRCLMALQHGAYSRYQTATSLPRREMTIGVLGERDRSAI
jgi:hypothetical protein